MIQGKNTGTGKEGKDSTGGFDIKEMTQNLSSMLDTFSQIGKMDEKGDTKGADEVLDKMLKEVGNITNIVGGKVGEMVSSIKNDPNFSGADKDQYLNITNKIKKLTDAIGQMSDNPDGAEKALNEVMDSFKNDMGDFTKDISNSNSNINNNTKYLGHDTEEEIEDLKNRVRKLERKVDKLREIIEKIMSRIIGTK